eukprot:CAMPEP_0115280122 /NCGR_PEP_ID=MMETSP0270-20121206/58623_1 /TAXON_ID=71861 /ORGANISM="Scrippsiella trochoidea, Strain CCMP3099" /LENGTH=266 /DNA_ID=CAMNT_0002696845 /DNA_START=55 /DNA_END=857 /DNA_ORIENTATION=+
MTKRSARPVFGNKELSLIASLLAALPVPTPATDWINWHQVFAQPTTTTTTTPEPSFKSLFCKNYPDTPIVCAKLINGTSTSQTSGETCEPNDARCCKASSCYAVPPPGSVVGSSEAPRLAWALASQSRAGSSLREASVCAKKGAVSDKGHCADAPDKTAMLVPAAHTWSQSLNEAVQSVQNVQSKVEVGHIDVDEAEVPPENVERTLAVLALGAVGAVAATVTLGVRGARRLMRPSAEPSSAESEPLAVKHDGQPDEQLLAVEERA